MTHPLTHLCYVLSTRFEKQSVVLLRRDGLNPRAHLTEDNPAPIGCESGLPDSLIDRENMLRLNLGQTRNPIRFLKTCYFLLCDRFSPESHYVRDFKIVESSRAVAFVLKPVG